MATRSQYSTSLRQSLGPPMRVEKADVASTQPRRKSKMPVMAVGGRPSMPAHQKRPPLGSQTQRRQTQVLGQGSMAGGATASRRNSRSSMYGQSLPTMRKDPRPLSDKSYQSASIKKLIAFLSERNYPSNLSPRTLHAPSTKEFLHILNFMLEMIDGSLVVDPMKIVEEVPRVLKVLGYPFTVSKNHMLNVGSPHSWPILLGALTWIIDLCLVPDNSREILFPTLSGFSDQEQTEDEKEFEVAKMMYQAFMERGADSSEYQEMVQQREEYKRRQYVGYQEECDRLRQENATISANIEELSKSSIPALQAQIQQNKSDCSDLLQHINGDLVPSIKELEVAQSQQDATASEIEMQTEACKEKASDLEEQIVSQPMSAGDARDLLQGIQDAEDTLEKNRRMQEENLERITELQMQHNRSVSLIDDECRQANDMLRRLGALLPDAASLPPLEYDTSKRADPEVLQKLTDKAKALRQDIQGLHGKVATSISEIENQIISGETTQSALHNEILKKQLEVDNVQHTLDIEKDALTRRKRKFEEAIKSEQVKKHALEKQLMDLQQLLLGESTAQRDLAAVKKQVEVETRALAKTLGERTHQFQQYLVALTKYIEATQKKQKITKQNVEELIARFQKIKLPSVDPRYIPVEVDPKQE